MKYPAVYVIIVILCIHLSHAGPPFDTDDPETVRHKHWEFYISSMNTFHPGEFTGTCPHLEINYGLAPNVQVHLLTPVNYDGIPHQDADFGYGCTEIGVKYRFVNETKDPPQIGVFPIIEIPSMKNNKFTDGKVQVYIPLWAQKSWGTFTTYGGAGYWINPGARNKNWIFAGWEAQYDISPVVTLGGELYFHSADAPENKPVSAFNTGGSLNISQKVHIIFSAGHSITGDSFTSAYAGFLFTI